MKTRTRFGRTVSGLLAALLALAVVGVAPARADSLADVPVWRMVADLGTLGGPNSTASAISGTLVVGESERADGSYTAFAYDHANPQAGMRDLGSLGGPLSSATDVEGYWVVGWAGSTVTNQFGMSVPHAFAMDLSAPSPRMWDLGVLGDPSVDSDVRAISGNTVVGRMGGRGFVVALDTGNLAYLPTTAPSPVDIDGTTVVGVESSPDGLRHVVYDLVTEQRRDLGLSAGARSS